MKIDNVANMKASRIIVKCPESICKFEDELRNMEDRINSHEITYSYFDIGCSDIAMNNLNIIDDLVDEEFFHTSPLMVSMDSNSNIKMAVQRIGFQLTGQGSRQDPSFCSLAPE